MALGLTDKIGYAVVLALAARLTLLNRNFVNGPYTQPTTAQTVVDVQRRIRDIRALTRAYEPVFGTISKVHGSYEVNKGVGEPYGRFHSFKLFDGGFDYSMDWHLGGPGTPISFNCTCHNVLEPADEARLPDAISLACLLPLASRELASPRAQTESRPTTVRGRSDVRMMRAACPPQGVRLVRTVHFQQLGNWAVPLWLVTKLNSGGQKAELAELAKLVA